MIVETVDTRVLGALRFVDAVSEQPVSNGLAITAGAGVLLRPNGRGFSVIWQAPGLESHTRAFEKPPEQPALGAVSLDMQVEDRLHRFLPRRFRLQLPRDPEPAHSNQATSLFRPHEVALFRSPAATVPQGVAALRVHVSGADNDEPLAGALLRVSRDSDGSLLGRGLSDKRGEAVVLLPSLPSVIVQGDDDGSVVTHEVEATLRVFYDLEAPSPPDPNAIEAKAIQPDGLPSAAQALSLVAGKTFVARVRIQLEDE